MSSAVDTLGLVAGSVWVCAACYFQLIRARPVHPKYIVGMLLVGSGIIMGSAAAAIGNRPTLVLALAIMGNIIFAVLGVAVWVYVDRHGDIVDATDVDDPSHRA